MTTITVKNIPNELYEQLKKLAEVNHRSINSEIIVCIERAIDLQPLDASQFLREARQLRELTADYIVSDTELTSAKTAGRP